MKICPNETKALLNDDLVYNCALYINFSPILYILTFLNFSKIKFCPLRAHVWYTISDWYFQAINMCFTHKYKHFDTLCDNFESSNLDLWCLEDFFSNYDLTWPLMTLIILIMFFAQFLRAHLIEHTLALKKCCSSLF